MKKYILLLIPIFYFKDILLRYNSLFHLENVTNSLLYLEDIINFLIVMMFIIFILRHTGLKNIFDWIIAICFTIYFCVLYHKTIQSGGILLAFDHELSHFSLENAGYVFNTVNLTPFKGIISVISNNISELNVWYQLIGNTIMLTPLSFAMLYFKWTSNYKQTIWASFICTVGIEFSQFLICVYYRLFEIGTNRSVDIDDVLLNTIGACIGMGCYYIWLKIKKLFTKKQSDIPV